MGNVFRSILKMYNLAPGDFPDLPHFQSIAREQDFSSFHKLRLSMLEEVETVLSVDIPRLMDALPRSLDDGHGNVVVMSAIQPMASAPKQPPRASPPPPPKVVVEEEAPIGKAEEANPFDDEDFGAESAWGLQDYIPMYQAKFNDTQEGGFVSGGAAKNLLVASGLAKTVLRQIWDLADVTKDGKLDLYEFVIAMFFADMVKEGHDELPATLAHSMIPPSASK